MDSGNNGNRGILITHFSIIHLSNYLNAALQPVKTLPVTGGKVQKTRSLERSTQTSRASSECSN